jgi:hypothetical protein
MVTTWQSYGRNKPDSQTMRFWFDKLINYDLRTVADAFDKWLITQKELPTVSEILKLCQPVTPIYNAIAKKTNREANKQYAENVVNFVQENTKKSGRNWIKFWEDKLNNPKGQSEIVLRFAKDALKQLGKEWHGNNSDSQATSNNLAINSHN